MYTFLSVCIFVQQNALLGAISGEYIGCTFLWFIHFSCPRYLKGWLLKNLHRRIFLQLLLIVIWVLRLQHSFCFFHISRRPYPISSQNDHRGQYRVSSIHEFFVLIWGQYIPINLEPSPLYQFLSRYPSLPTLNIFKTRVQILSSVF